MSTNFLHSVLFPILEDIDINFLNQIVLEYIALSSVNAWNNLSADVNFSTINTFTGSAVQTVTFLAT